MAHKVTMQDVSALASKLRRAELDLLHLNKAKPDKVALTEAKQAVTRAAQDLAVAKVRCLIDQANNVGKARTVAWEIFWLLTQTSPRVEADRLLLKEVTTKLGLVCRAMRLTLPTTSKRRVGSNYFHAVGGQGFGYEIQIWPHGGRVVKMQ